MNPQFVKSCTKWLLLYVRFSVDIHASELFLKINSLFNVYWARAFCLPITKITPTSFHFISYRYYYVRQRTNITFLFGIMVRATNTDVLDFLCCKDQTFYFQAKNFIFAENHFFLCQKFLPHKQEFRWPEQKVSYIKCSIPFVWLPQMKRITEKRIWERNANSETIRIPFRVRIFTFLGADR